MQILKEKIVRYETDGSIVKGYDAGELVRCKDCKYNQQKEWVLCVLHSGFFGRTPDNYCSMAERKEE